MADQQPRVDSVTWAPMYDPRAAMRRSRTWSAAGVVAAVLTIVAAILIAAGDANRQLAMFGIGAVVAVGLVLIASGIGLLGGEALRAEILRVAGGDSLLASTSDQAEGLAKILTALKDALTGLSAARVLLFLGTVLLVAGAAAAVVASGILD